MSITEAEKVVRDALGENHTPVKLSGYWLIHRRNADDSRDLLAQSRSLPRAIEQARGAA